MIKIAIKLIHKGWVNVIIDNNETELSIFSSHFSDFLTDLVVGTRLIISSETDLLLSSQEEPGQYRWHISRDCKQLNLVIFWFEETFSKLGLEKGKQIYSASADVICFAREIIRAMDRLKFEYGVVDYREICTYEFPEKEMEALRETYRNMKK